ncbi:hypothetical protein E4U49_000144 [Claviceps purpurea]|nr:hypothetical protein E4U49_000144 [Claviceps purpurea]
MPTKTIPTTKSFLRGEEDGGLGPQRPQPRDYEAKAGIEEPTQASHLSKDGLEAFKEDKLQHKDLVDDWKVQFHHYKEEWNRAASRPAGLTLTDWIPNLKDSVGADDDTERERVRTWYRTTGKPMRNLDNWLAWGQRIRPSLSVGRTLGYFMAAIPRSEQGCCDSFRRRKARDVFSLLRMTHTGFQEFRTNFYELIHRGGISENLKEEFLVHDGDGKGGVCVLPHERKGAEAP